MRMSVIDSIMGSGKTTWMIDHINETHRNELADSFDTGILKPTRYLVITPNLTEVDRISAACPSLGFKNPQPINGRKYWGLEHLVRSGENVCATHALFKLLNRDIYDELKQQGYTLVIDEALDCVDLFKGLTKADRNILFQNDMVSVEPETYRLCWNEDLHHDYKGKYEDVMGLCRNGNLVFFKNSTLLWEFPVEFLECFKQVYVLTYLFHGSAMASYLSANRVRFDMYGIQDGKRVKWEEIDEAAIKAKLRPLINIYEGKGNKIGSWEGKGNRPMSSSWYENQDGAVLAALKASTENYFKKIAKTPSSVNCWTTFKAYRSKVAGKRYSRGFLPNNLRATNSEIHRRSMAYLCNTFFHPTLSNYFKERKVTTYEDLYALSEMLQWIWRSGIRRYDNITLFIPSDRMRNLLKTWLESETMDDLFTKTGSGIKPSY